MNETKTEKQHDGQIEEEPCTLSIGANKNSPGTRNGIRYGG